MALWERAQSDPALRARLLLASRGVERTPQNWAGAYDEVNDRIEASAFRKAILKFLEVL